MAAERRVLRAAGVEWEPLYLGALASGQLQGVAPLVRAGSDRTARLLIELAGMEEQESTAPAELRRYLLTPMATFVSSDGPCDGYETVSSWDATRDADAPSIDPYVQQAILDRLAQAVQPEVGLDEALDASHALLRLCRAESRDAFHAMLRSPYGDVRERGVLGLRALGEAVADPVPPAPVEIRLLVDGRTWEPPVTWELEGTANHRAGATADREGVLRLDRDPFVDPTSPIESVAVGSDELTSPEGTWFSVRFKPPADLDDRTLLSVRTGSLTVVVPPEVHPSPRGQPGPFLMLFNDPEDREEPVITHLPVRPGRYVFPHLQYGRYLARVFLPDATVLESPRIEVGERPGTVELEPVASAEDWIDAADPDEHDPLPEP
jgi:hypothetical protein